jgi:hypothetical protein
MDLSCSACPPIFEDPSGPRLGGGNNDRRIVIVKPSADKPEALRRREKAFCFQISAPPRLCGEKDLRGLF